MATPHKSYPADAVKKIRLLKREPRANGIEDEAIIEAIKALRRGVKVKEVAIALGMKPVSWGNLYAHIGSWAIRSVDLD